jgi:hypothetical protein
MKTNATTATILSLALLLGTSPTQAQTPEQQRQMEYERQQREYWRAQEQQRQEQQRQQQLMQDNARRQQEESARASRGSATPQAPEAAPPAGAGGAMGGAAGANLERARQEWPKRPPLAVAQNPLLGAWTRPAARTNANDPFAQLGALMKGGVCEVFFSGDAVFEFRPGTLVGIDKRTHRADVLDQVEYRGGGKQVVVIPKASLKLIVFDFDGRDRIQWAGQNCTLTRVGVASQAAAQGSRR